jgi:hypothetical protein
MEELQWGGGIAGKMVGVWKEEKIYKLFGCIKR